MKTTLKAIKSYITRMFREDVFALVLNIFRYATFAFKLIINFIFALLNHNGCIRKDFPTIDLVNCSIIIPGDFIWIIFHNIPCKWVDSFNCRSVKVQLHLQDGLRLSVVFQSPIVVIGDCIFDSLLRKSKTNPIILPQSSSNFFIESIYAFSTRLIISASDITISSHLSDTDHHIKFKIQELSISSNTPNFVFNICNLTIESFEKDSENEGNLIGDFDDISWKFSYNTRNIKSQVNIRTINIIYGIPFHELIIPLIKSIKNKLLSDANITLGYKTQYNDYEHYLSIFDKTHEIIDDRYFNIQPNTKPLTAASSLEEWESNIDVNIEQLTFFLCYETCSKSLDNLRNSSRTTERDQILRLEQLIFSQVNHHDFDSTSTKLQVRCQSIQSSIHPFSPTLSASLSDYEYFYSTPKASTTPIFQLNYDKVLSVTSMAVSPVSSPDKEDQFPPQHGGPDPFVLTNNHNEDGNDCGNGDNPLLDVSGISGRLHERNRLLNEEDNNSHRADANTGKNTIEELSFDCSISEPLHLHIHTDALAAILSFATELSENLQWVYKISRAFERYSKVESRDSACMPPILSQQYLFPDPIGNHHLVPSFWRRFHVSVPSVNIVVYQPMVGEVVTGSPSVRHKTYTTANTESNPRDRWGKAREGEGLHAVNILCVRVVGLVIELTARDDKGAGMGRRVGGQSFRSAIEIVEVNSCTKYLEQSPDNRTISEQPAGHKMSYSFSADELLGKSKGFLTIERVTMTLTLHCRLPVTKENDMESTLSIPPPSSTPTTRVLDRRLNQDWCNWCESVPAGSFLTIHSPEIRSICDVLSLQSAALIAGRIAVAIQGRPSSSSSSLGHPVVVSRGRLSHYFVAPEEGVHLSASSDGSNHVTTTTYYHPISRTNLQLSVDRISFDLIGLYDENSGVASVRSHLSPLPGQSANIRLDMTNGFDVEYDSVSNLFHHLHVSVFDNLLCTYLSPTELSDSVSVPVPIVQMSFPPRAPASVTTNPPSSSPPLFEWSAFPSELHTTSATGLSLGLRIVECRIVLPRLTLNAEVSCMESIAYTCGVIIGGYQVGQRLGQDKESYNVVSNGQNMLRWAFESPSSIVTFQTERIQLSLLLDTKPVTTINASDIVVNVVKYGDTMRQTTGLCRRFVLQDDCLRSAHHRFIINNVQPSHPNSFRFYHNICLLEKPRERDHSTLLQTSDTEVYGDGVSVLYLHRVYLSLLAYHRDYLHPRVHQSFKNGCQRLKYFGTSLIPLKPVANVKHPHVKTISSFGLKLTNSEIHLPNNSCGRDAICFLIPDLHYNTSSPGLAQNLSEHRTESYQQGKAKLSNWQSTESFSWSGTDVPTWRMKPQGLVGEECSGEGTRSHVIEINKAVICSWCSSNMISKETDIRIEFLIKPVTTELDGIYSGVLHGLGYQLKEEMFKNCYEVNVSIMNLEWTLTKGQYTAIFYFIEQNFNEQIEQIHDQSHYPVPKTVNVTEELFGKNPFDKRLPKSLSLKICFAPGCLVAIENEADYYEKYMTAQETGKGFQPPIDPFTDDHLSAPSWSNHYEYQNVIGIYSKNRMNVEARNTMASLDRVPSRQGNGSQGIDGPKRPPNGQPSPLICMYFSHLELHFYRIHHGGGHGLTVTAKDLVVENMLKDLESVRPNLTPKGKSGDGTTHLRSYNDVFSVAPERILLRYNKFKSSDRQAVNKSTTFIHENLDKKEKDDLHPINMNAVGDFNDVDLEGIQENDQLDVELKVSSFGEEDLVDMIPERMTTTELEEGISVLVSEDDYYDSSSKFEINPDSSSPTSTPPTTEHKGSTTLVYDLQVVGNLRRCVLDIKDSVLLVVPDVLGDVFEFFLEAATLRTQREEAFLTEVMKIRPLDYLMSLDFEMNFHDLTMVIPNYIKIGLGRNLCFLLDVTHHHIWRGLPVLGPFRTEIRNSHRVKSAYISSLDEVNSEFIESLLDNFTINFIYERKLTCTQHQSENHFKIIKQMLDLPSHIFRPSRDGKQNEIQFFSMEIDIPDTSNMSKRSIAGQAELITPIGDGQSTLHSRLSIMDINFLYQLLSTFLKKHRQPKQSPFTIRETYSKLFKSTSLQDVGRSYRVSSYVTSAPIPRQDTEIVRKTEMLFKLCNQIIRIKNNIYHTNILRIDICSTSLSFSWSSSNIHMAGNMTLLAWSYNDLLENWEPVIEGLHLTAISATDQSDVTDGGLHKLRLDVHCSALDITLSHVMLTGLSRKLQLADVISSNSSKMPPYKLRNQLGLPVHFDVLVGEDVVVSRLLGRDDWTAIDMRSLRIDSKNRQNIPQSTDRDDEHKLRVSFVINGVTFQSYKPVPIDREGVLPLQIRITNRKQSMYSHNEKSSRNFEDTVYSSSTKSVPLPSSTSEESSREDPQQQRNSLKSPIITESDIPMIFLVIAIKDDGSSELSLQSMVTLRNTTTAKLFLSARNFGSSIENELLPGQNWILPVTFAHPQTSLAVKLVDSNAINTVTDSSLDEPDLPSVSEWVEVTSNLGSLVVQGIWGYPRIMKSDWCVCPLPKNSNNLFDRKRLDSKEKITTTGFLGSRRDAVRNANSKTDKGVEKDVKWSCLILPDVVDPKSSQLGEKLSVRFSNPIINSSNKRESTESAASGNGDQLVNDGADDDSKGNALSNRESDRRSALSSVMDVKGIESKLFPLNILFTSALHLSNLVCQPLLFRISDFDGFVSNEGVLCPGQSLPLYQVSNNFTKSLYISIRMVNYCWSPWIRILNEKSPFPAAEKNKDIQLSPMELSFEGRELALPILLLNLTIHERFVRIFCPIRIRNATGVRLGIRQTPSVTLGDMSNIDTNSMVPHAPNDNFDTTKTLVQHEGKADQSRQGRTLNEVAEEYVVKDIGRNTDVMIGGIENDPLYNQEQEQQVNHSLAGMSSPNPSELSFLSPSFQSPQSTMGKRVIFNNALKAEELKYLEVYLPTDHFQLIRVPLSSPTTTMEEVLHYIGEHMSQALLLCSSSLWQEKNIDDLSSSFMNSFSSTDYVFFSSNDPIVPSLIESSPSAEEAVFMSLRSMSTNSSSIPKQSGHQMSSSISGHSSSHHNELPHPLRFGMLTSCSQTPIPMQSLASSLVGTRVRLCHATEWDVYLQVNSLRAEALRKENKVLSMFIWQKYLYRTRFISFQGDIPYNPPSVLGLSQSFQIQVLDESSWSNPITLSKFSGYNGGLSCVSVTGFEKRFARGDIAAKYYDFGMLWQRGIGSFRDVKSITIVPRYILISKMREIISIRQTDCVMSSQIISLHYNKPHILNFPFAEKSKYLQMLIGKTKSDIVEESLLGIGITNSRIWSGEFDISLIGTFHVKLRDPLLIVRIHVESVGGSLVVSFSEENSSWPPYRIENHTSFDLNFKQHSSKPNMIKKNWPLYDQVGSRASCPYAWDLPHTGNLVLRLEIGEAVDDEAIELDVDNLEKPIILKLQTQLPDFKYASLEGFLMKKRATAYESWHSCYCILLNDLLYTFRDETKNELLGIICLTQRTEIDIEVASVVKYSPTRWDILNSIEKSLMWSDHHSRDSRAGIEYRDVDRKNGLGQRGLSGVDLNVNQIRLLLLKVIGSLEMLRCETGAADFFDEALDEGDGEGGTREKGRDTCDDPHDGDNHDDEDDDDDGEEKKGKDGGDDGEEKKGKDGGDDGEEKKGKDGGDDGDDEESAESEPEGHTPQGKKSDIMTSINEIRLSQQQEDLAAYRGKEKKRTIFQRRKRRNSISDAILRSLLMSRDGQACNIDTKIFDSVKNIPVSLTSIVQILERFKLPSKEICAHLITNDILVGCARTDYKEFVEVKHMTVWDYVDMDSSSESSQESLATIELGGESTHKGSTHITSHVGAATTTNTTLKSSFYGISEKSTGSPEVTIESRANVLSMFRNNTYSNLMVRIIAPELHQISSIKVPTYPSNMDDDKGDLEGDLGTDSERVVKDNYSTCFQVSLGDTSSHVFRCSSASLLHAWIWKCRLNIEKAVVHHLLGEVEKESRVTIESFRTTVVIDVRTDGPTRVIQLTEEIDLVNDNMLDTNPTPEDSATTNAKKTVLKDEREPSNSDEISNFQESQQSLSLSVSVTSIGISVVDAEPAEVIYFSIQDVSTSIERVPNPDQLRVSLTIQTIQMDNQLIDPLYPINLRPRNQVSNLSKENRLMLPGLYQNDGSFPSIHFFCQQTFNSKSTVDRNEIVNQNVDTNYYDIFTIWVTPLEFTMEEETFIRIYRIFSELKQGIKAVKHSQRFQLVPLLRNTSKTIKKESKVRYSRGIPDTEMWELERRFSEFSRLPLLAYEAYGARQEQKSNLYFALLQLHPIDILLTFRTSPGFKSTVTESLLISNITQLDAARFCLNALVIEHAFGTTSFILEVLAKHYRGTFLRQLGKMIGSTDIVEGSVGLVANLGTGVYDLFYEPIEGLLDKNGSFVQGLSKGGKSLATRAIGGTSAFTSKITGGLGKGMSILTLDSDFQMKRAKSKIRAAHSVTEGLYVGTKELSTNIFEGVTGIVVAPYKGWVEDGGRGLGIGIAKGLLGVALKPAVGVVDFASRTTEGIRYSAFSKLSPDGDVGHSDVVAKVRPPRTINRSGLLTIYDAESAAAQLVIDRLTKHKKNSRFQVVHYYNFDRRIPRALRASRLEMWGFIEGTSYLALVGVDRVVLISANKTGSLDFVWSCPAECIEQLFNDSNGDLILVMNTCARCGGVWNDKVPVILDGISQDYVTFQILLEQSIGVKLARRHPLIPTGGILKGPLLRKHTSGLRGMLMQNTKHTYVLYDHALYEYTYTEVKVRQQSMSSNASVLSQTRNPSTTDVSSESGSLQGSASPSLATLAPTDGELTAVYSLYDLQIDDPRPDEGERFYLRITRKTPNATLFLIKRSEESNRLQLVNNRDELTIICGSLKSAWIWKKGLEERIVYHVDDSIDHTNSGTSFRQSRFSRLGLASFQSMTSANAVSPYQSGLIDDTIEGSILTTLTLPVALTDPQHAEALKIEIAKTLSTVRWSNI